MARAAPPDRPAHARVLRAGLRRSRTADDQPAGADGVVHAFHPRGHDQCGARHAALEGDAETRGVGARGGLAAPLAGGPLHGAQAADLLDANGRPRSLPAASRRLRARGDRRGDRVRDLRARGAAACRVPPSDRHTGCCAHRVAGCGGRGARSDAEHGVGALTGVGHEAVSSSATPRSRLGRTPHAFCIFAPHTVDARARWERTDPGAS
jgi:hypothetical protein